ncbi:MAG: Gfo/Idh/MocA family oxidoreductase [Phycisphaerales bacterium]|nr:MAG: Gfo/Idh/MocA family oxidoreductase [Phycisphaerales bacterium]
MQRLLKAGVIGVGNWGRNVLRCFAQSQRCSVEWVCDLDEKMLAKQAPTVPRATATMKVEDVLDSDCDAVVIATAAVTHSELARRALEAGKHVYVEKPLCLSARDAEQLLDLANARQRKLMVGHLLLYHPCVERLAEMIRREELGAVYYMYTQRVNLGVVRQDENAWWSLAPHDISVVCHLFGSQPVAVSASGQCYLQKGIEDVVFAMLRFADGRIAHVHVSWLDPHKIRKMTVVGSERMVTFDDMEASEKIRVYDKGAEVKAGYESFAQSVAIRSGDITIPRVNSAEPLRIEAQHFVDCVLDNKPIRTDGADGVRVVRTLEAGAESLRRGGEVVSI